MTVNSYKFGDFRLDPAARELWRGNELLELSRLNFDGLVFLVKNYHRAVSRDELIHAVWGDAEIEDNQVTHLIMRLRRVLGDDSREPRFIRAVPGFGYRWVATVENPSVVPAKRSIWRWVALAIALLGVLAAVYLLRGFESSGPGPEGGWADGDIAILLPVRIEADDSHGWIRLGLMDLMAERLRAAGQPMVPSDTVVALSRDHPVEPGPDDLDSLIATTSARLILGAEAMAIDGGWRVSLQSLSGAQPRLRASGEAEDVLVAGRIAVDRVALALGLAPAMEQRTETDLTLLLQQTEAAMLAQQMDVARKLIDNADAALRQTPRIRLQLARIDAYSHELDAAEAAFEALRQEPVVLEDPMLHMRVLYGLGMIYFRRGNLEANWSLLEEATGLVDHESQIPLGFELGRLNVAVATAVGVRDGLEAARPHFVRARIALESAADIEGLAGLDNNLAGLEFQRGRYVRALQYLERSATRFRALNDVGSELRTLFNSIRGHLSLLELQSAIVLEQRLEELMALTTDPALIANARLARVEVAIARGRIDEAEHALGEVLELIETRTDLHELRVVALVLQAEQAARQGDMAVAQRIAAETLGWLPAGYPFLEARMARARLIIVRASLAMNDLKVANRAVEALERWAEDSDIPSIVVDVLLARAEMAAAAGQTEKAERLFDRALAFATDSHMPVTLLDVCSAYVSWLIDTRGPRDSERALLVAAHIDGYADRHYDAALLQLRAYHAAGVAPAWRRALERSRALAGEREIPAELLQPPA